MDAIEFLTQEHDKAQASFRRILQASPDQRGAIWDEVQPELEAHEQIEEACLYEPLSNDGGSTDVKYTAWKQQHQAEVRALDGLVQSMNGLLVPRSSLARASAGHLCASRKPQATRGRQHFSTDPRHLG